MFFAAADASTGLFSLYGAFSRRRFLCCWRLMVLCVSLWRALMYGARRPWRVAPSGAGYLGLLTLLAASFGWAMHQVSAVFWGSFQGHGIAGRMAWPHRLAACVVGGCCQ
jgi:hypothetical protein